MRVGSAGILGLFQPKSALLLSLIFVTHTTFTGTLTGEENKSKIKATPSNRVKKVLSLIKSNSVLRSKQQANFADILHIAEAFILVPGK